MSLAKLLLGLLFFLALAPHARAQAPCPTPNPNASAWTSLTGPRFQGADSSPSVNCSLPAGGLNGAFQTMATAIQAIPPPASGCPSGWICVTPTDTITDETNVQNALNAAAAIASGNGRPGVMLLPGRYYICSQMTWPTGVDISGVVWHNDDPISSGVSINLAMTAITCPDGSFSRFTSGQAFFSTTSQNQTMQNLQFYGSFYQGHQGANVNCVNMNTAPSTTGGSIVTHNSFVGCNRGLSLDSAAGGFAQDSEIADNFFISNYNHQIYCSCSDMRIHHNHFGNTGGGGANPNQYDIFVNGGQSMSINDNRFEFADNSISVVSGSRIVITGNDFDKVQRGIYMTGVAGSPTKDIAITGNKINMGNSTFGSVIEFLDGGGAVTSLKLDGINISGNSMNSDSANATAYYSDNLYMLGVQIHDLPNISVFNTASSMRVLSPFITFSPQFDGGFNNMCCATHGGVAGSTANQLQLGGVTLTGIASEAFATSSDTNTAAELITEDTSNGAHKIASATGTGGGFGTGQQMTFSAIIKAGSTARDFGFLWNDNGSNAIGEIWNSSTCAPVGTYGLAGSGNLIGAATGNVLNGGFCFIKATFTLGTATAVTVANNEIDLCLAAACAAYTGTTGSVILQDPTFKPCLATSGTAC